MCIGTAGAAPCSCSDRLAAKTRISAVAAPIHAVLRRAGDPPEWQCWGQREGSDPSLGSRLFGIGGPSLDSILTHRPETIRNPLYVRSVSGFASQFLEAIGLAAKVPRPVGSSRCATISEAEVSPHLDAAMNAIDELATALGRLLAIEQLIRDQENEELRQCISALVGREVPPVLCGFVDWDPDSAGANAVASIQTG